MKEIAFGENGDITPNAVGGSTTTFFCDYFYTSIPSSGSAIRGLLFGGNANNGAWAGFGYANSYNTPSSATTYIGSRLCFIP
jgi:hypothetical protein